MQNTTAVLPLRARLEQWSWTAGPVMPRAPCSPVLTCQSWMPSVCGLSSKP